MSIKCPYSVAIVFALAVGGCGGKRAADTAPTDPFSRIGIGPLPVGSLSGANVLLLTTGGVLVGDSTGAAPELEGRRTALLEAANAALDTALRRDGREVDWQGLEEQRRVARRNPTLGIAPDRLATAYVLDPSLDRVPDPLWSGLRTLSAMTGSRYALIPAVVRVGGAEGSYRAEYVIVVADTRSGGVRFRGRAIGRPAPTPEAALASAAGSVLATPLTQSPRPQEP